MSEIDTSTAAVELPDDCRHNDRHGTICRQCGLATLHRLRAECDAERQRADAAEALAYIGDHKFPDLTWKHRCSELVEDLRAKDAEVARLRDALMVARNTVGDLRIGFARHVDPARWVNELQAHIDEALQPTPDDPRYRLRAQVAQVKAETWREAANFLYGEGQPGYAENCEARATEAQGEVK